MTSRNTLNTVARVVTFTLFLNVKKKCFSILSLSMMLAMIVVYSPYHASICSFYNKFVEIFYHERVLNFIIFFIDWQDPMIFILHSINVIYHIYWFTYVEPFSNLRDKFLWPWCSILLMKFCFLFSGNVLGTFIPIYIRNIGPYCSFFVVSLSDFYVRVMLAL